MLASKFGGHLRFAHEPLAELLGLRGGRQQQLERDALFQLQMSCRNDDAHAAASDDLFNLVLACQHVAGRDENRRQLPGRRVFIVALHTLLRSVLRIVDYFFCRHFRKPEVNLTRVLLKPWFGLDLDPLRATFRTFNR